LATSQTAAVQSAQAAMRLKAEAEEIVKEVGALQTKIETAALRERQTAEKPLQQALAAVREATQTSELLTRTIDANGRDQAKLATSAKELQTRIDSAAATLVAAKKEAEAVPVVANLETLRQATQKADQDRELAIKTAKTVESDLAEATRKAGELQNR